MSERDALILRWLPLAYKAARDLWGKSYRVRLLGWEDAAAWAAVGLADAAARFDPGRGLSFGTLAYRCCRGWLAKGARLATLVRVPHRPHRREGYARAAGLAMRPGRLPDWYDEPSPERRPEQWPERLATARAALPEADRALLALRYEGGLTCRRIAPVLGLSVPGVKMRARAALRRLRREYEKAWGDE